MSYKTSHIELNVPNRVLGVTVNTVSGKTVWPHANGSNDRWYSGGSSPKNLVNLWTLVEQMKMALVKMDNPSISPANSLCHMNFLSFPSFNYSYS